MALADPWAVGGGEVEMGGRIGCFLVGSLDSTGSGDSIPMEKKSYSIVLIRMNVYLSSVSRERWGTRYNIQVRDGIII